MKAKFLTVAVFVLTLNISSVYAQIRHRAHNQHHRIKQGVKSGELTRHEVFSRLSGRHFAVQGEVNRFPTSP